MYSLLYTTDESIVEFGFKRFCRETRLTTRFTTTELKMGQWVKGQRVSDFGQVAGQNFRPSFNSDTHISKPNLHYFDLQLIC